MNKISILPRLRKCPLPWRGWGRCLFLLELLSLPLLPVVSWVVSVYNPSAHSLLDANGLRWLMTSWVSNFTSLPLGEAVLVQMALSVVQASGLPDLLRGRLSLKQQRALMFMLAALVFILAAVAAMTLLPPYTLLNFFGGVTDSPLMDSLPGLLFLTAEVLSCVYGYTAGKIVTIGDFSQAHTLLLIRCAPLFVHVFLLSQIIAWIKYSYFL